MKTLKRILEAFFPFITAIINVENSDEVKYHGSVVSAKGWEIINDEVGNENIVVITRPKLTSVFFAGLDDDLLEFEFIDNKIFDKNTNSEWNFLGHAINGTLKGEKLKAAPIVYAFWFGWVVEYPDTLLYNE